MYPPPPAPLKAMHELRVISFHYFFNEITLTSCFACRGDTFTINAENLKKKIMERNFTTTLLCLQGGYM
jgi:hypothetical protein